LEVMDLGIFQPWKGPHIEDGHFYD